MKTELQPDEIQVARELWEDLSHGVEGAHEKLRQVPHKIRFAILGELVVSMNTRTTATNPFE